MRLWCGNMQPIEGMLGLAVGEIAICSPGSGRVLWKHGIDYGSQGKETLRRSCELARVDASRVCAELNGIQDPFAVRWKDLQTADLIRLMTVRYHQPLLGELARLSRMARGAAISDNGRHPALVVIAALVARLEMELGQRIAHEESLVFPIIRAGGAIDPAMCAFASPLAGQLLADIRGLSCAYTPWEDSQTTLPPLFLGLQMLDMDIVEHLHLENNLLFPRVLDGAMP